MVTFALWRFGGRPCVGVELASTHVNPVYPVPGEFGSGDEGGGGEGTGESGGGLLGGLRGGLGAGLGGGGVDGDSGGDGDADGGGFGGGGSANKGGTAHEGGENVRVRVTRMLHARVLMLGCMRNRW